MSGVDVNLARFEGRMLVRHPVAAVGAVFIVLMVVANVGSPWEADAYSLLGGLGAATLGPFALIASNGAGQLSTGSAWWHVLWLLGWAGLGIAAVLLDRRHHLTAPGGVGLLVLVPAGGAQLP